MVYHCMVAVPHATPVDVVMEYFEIFMKRMLLCRQAAERLALTFKLAINGQVLV